MSETTKKDTLLITAKVVLQILSALIAFGIVCLILGLFAIATDYEGRVSDLLGGAPPEAVWWLAGVCVAGLALLGLAILFVFQLIMIVNSVGEGDPFAPENAERLSRMAWLALAIQLMQGVISPLTYMLSKYVDDVSIENGISLHGLSMVLVLFILARVFRKGAEMKADLEGTV